MNIFFTNDNTQAIVKTKSILAQAYFRLHDRSGIICIKEWGNYAIILMKVVYD